MATCYVTSTRFSISQIQVLGHSCKKKFMTILYRGYVAWSHCSGKIKRFDLSSILKFITTKHCTVEKLGWVWKLPGHPTLHMCTVIFIGLSRKTKQYTMSFNIPW